MFHSAPKVGSEVYYEVDKRSLSFNFLLENASLSKGLDAQRACARARAPTHTGNTHRPLLDLLFRDECEPWQHEAIEHPLFTP
jgi:hypothetical protein